MKTSTFEDYLQECHAKQYEGLDDEMVDDYFNWVVDLDISKVIEYADEWGASLKGGVK